jgi:hypothetical protein
MTLRIETAALGAERFFASLRMTALTSDHRHRPANERVCGHLRHLRIVKSVSICGHPWIGRAGWQGEGRTDRAFDRWGVWP